MGCRHSKEVQAADTVKQSQVRGLARVDLHMFGSALAGVQQHQRAQQVIAHRNVSRPADTTPICTHCSQTGLLYLQRTHITGMLSSGE